MKSVCLFWVTRFYCFRTPDYNDIRSEHPKVKRTPYSCIIRTGYSNDIRTGYSNVTRTGYCNVIRTEAYGSPRYSILHLNGQGTFGRGGRGWWFMADWWLRGPIDDSQKFGKENEKNGYKFWYMKINYYLCKKSRS